MSRGSATARRVPSAAGTWTWGERQRFFVEADRRVRTPIPTSRRISFLSLKGGVGTSTVAASVARVAAARRGTPALAVDADGARHGLAEKLGWAEETRITPPDGIVTDPQTFAEASAGLAQNGTLSYLGLGHPASASWPSNPAEWADAVTPRGRFFPIVVTDWGRRRDLRAIADITRSSHAVCFVASADRAGLESAAALVPAIRADASHPDIVIALVDRFDNGASATRVRLGGLDATVLRVPFDPALAAGDRPRGRTRRATLAVSAALIAASTPAAIERVATG